MAYSNEPQDYPEKELLEVAELHYVEGLSHTKIADERGYKSRARVIAMCKAAVKAGMVRTAVIPSPLFSGERRRRLASRVRERFGLLDCIIVNGRAEMLSGIMTSNYREAILDDIARAAAQELESRFRDEKRPCLAVTYGSTARKVADAMPTGDGKASAGCVVPALGVRHEMMDRFGANAIARDIARQLGCGYKSLPLPAMLPNNTALLAAITQIDLVREVWESIQSANLALFALGTLHQTREHYEAEKQETIESNQMILSKSEMTLMRDNPHHSAIGNLGGWWFDVEGRDVAHPSGKVLFGIGLERVRTMVHERKPVILVTGADATYIPALSVALSSQNPLCNVWVGDEVTAHVLLGDWQLESGATGDSRFFDQEIEVMKTLY